MVDPSPITGGTRYEILRVLGRGGFGTVYLARYTGEGGFIKDVAIKVLNPGMDGLDEVASRLRDEARMLGLLRHRALVVVDRLTQINGQWAVVMEYVEGVDLRRLIKQGRLPARPAVEIIGEVAGALHAAYTRVGPDGQPMRLIHRDIKPSNLQITPYGAVKVLDYGIARAEFRGREGVTRSLHFGTPEYMAPERIDLVDGPEGDIYALGAVLFETLVGLPLGRTSSREDRHTALLRTAMGDLKATHAHPEVVALVERLLAWDPAARPTAREVERGCGALLDHLREDSLREWAERAVPAAAGQLPDEVTPRSSAGVDLTGSLVIGSPEGGAAPQPAAPLSVPTLTRPEGEDRQKRRAMILALGSLIAIGASGAVIWWKTHPGESVEAPRGVAPEEPGGSGHPGGATTPAGSNANADEQAPAFDPKTMAANEHSDAPGEAPTSVPTTAVEPVALAPTTRPTAIPTNRHVAATTTASPRPPSTPAVATAPPVPTPAPATAPRTAAVSVTGDARQVRLSGGGATYTLPATVPEGSYKIVADFPTWGTTEAGRLEVSAGKDVVVNCVSDLTTCTGRR